MKNIKRTLASLSALAALVAAVSLSPMSASAHMGKGGMGPAGAHCRMETELGLSAQQKQDIKALFTTCHTRNEPLIQRMRTERRALRKLIHAEKTDEAAIRAQSAKVAAIEADLAVRRAQAGQQMRALLTPEQVKKLKAVHDKRSEKEECCASCDKMHRGHGHGR